MADNSNNSFFDIWSLTKSIALLAAVGFVWYHGKAIADNFATSLKPAPPPTIERIDENAIKLAAISASKEAVKELKEEFEKERSKILAAYEEQRKKTNETMTALGKVEAELKQTRDLIDRKSDHVYVPEPTGDPEKDAKRKLNEQYFKEITIKDAQGQDVPLAWSIFYPNKPEGEKWKTGTFKLGFETRIVESENKDGTSNFYAETLMKSKDKIVNLPLKDVKYAKVPQRDKSFFLWNPRLGFGGNLTNNDVSAELNVSTSSYGRTTRDMDWRFFTFGLGASKFSEYGSEKWKGIASFEPFSWNTGNIIPVVQNAFVGPVITYDTESDVSYGLKLSIPF
jgi:hypothetical protein